MPTDAIGQTLSGITDSSVRRTEVRTVAPATTNEPPKTQAPASTNAADLTAVVEQIQQSLSKSNTGLQFSVDDSTGKTEVKVVDAQSGDVIRQIPNEEVMAISRNIGKMQGLLFHSKA